MSDAITAAKNRILERVDLSAVIGETVSLSKRSGKPTGLCPFHSENSPSFYVYEDRYYCFGCKANGDAIDFVRSQRGLSFIEALRFLAEKFGIEAPELQHSEREQHEQQKGAKLGRLMAAAQDIFRSHLHKPEGEGSRDYLRKRGFSDESIDAYGFGLTPQEPWALTRALKSRGASEADLIECSLATRSSKDGRLYDFFRQRLMIPIHDAQGRVIGFGGRTLDGHQAKYMNSRESPLFDKSSVLFGFDKARGAIRQAKRAFVAEGYMDVLKMRQFGLEETVGCLGTSLTIKHLRTLRGSTELVYLVFDGDSAGEKASLSAVELALTVPEVEIRVMTLPKGEDPDSYLDRYGIDGFEDLCRSAKGLLEFAVQTELSKSHELAIPDVVEKTFVPWLARMKDPMQRAFLVTRIAGLTGIRADTIVAFVRRTLSSASDATPLVRGATGDGSRMHTTPSAPLPPGPITPLRGEAFEFVGHIFFSEPGEIDPHHTSEFIKKEMELSPPFDAFAREILECLICGGAAHAADRSTWESTGSSAIADLIEMLYKNQRAFFGSHRTDCLEKLKTHIRRRRLKDAIRTLKGQISQGASRPVESTLLGSKELESPDTRQLLQAITQLNQELKQLDS